MANQPAQIPAASLLDKPRILFSSPGYFSQFLFYGPLLLLGTVGALGCFFGTFQVPVSPLPPIIVGGLCLVYFSLLFLCKRSLWPLYIVGILAWVGAVWYFFHRLLQGCAHTVNLVLDAYAEKFSLTLPVLQEASDLTPQEIQDNCTIFVCLFLFPYLFLLSWLLLGRKSALGAFCLTGWMVLFPLVISQIPPTPYLAALLLFWAVLLLFSPCFGQRRQLLENRSRFEAGGEPAARPFTLLMFLSVGALCMALTYCIVPPDTYQRPKIAQDLWQGITQGFYLDRSWQGGIGSGGSRVELSSLGERSYTGKTMLQVMYEWEDSSVSYSGTTNRQKDYLKSFVGSVYTGTSWERLSSQDRAELTQLLDGEHPQTLLDRSLSVLSGNNQWSYSVSVKNVGANPRSIYAPYQLVGDGVPSDLMEYVDDGFLQSSQFFGGTPAYTLKAWANPANFPLYPYRVITPIFEAYLETLPEGSTESITRDDIPENSGMDQLLDELSTLPIQDQNLISNRQWDLWTVPEGALDLLEPEQRKFIRTIESYNQFVYSHYTQLPEELKTTLSQFLEDSGLSSSLEYPTANPTSLVGQQIANTLAAQCTYTLNPPTLPEGKDFVEYFLFESRQGYCVHFATAAVALFRAAGIPARYAEGYAVPSGEEGWVNVPDYNAHAWVEIYVGSVGWIPLEVTPPGPEAPAATDDAFPVEAAIVTPTPLPTPTPSPTPQATPKESASPSPNRSTPSPVPQQQSASPENGWIAILWVPLGIGIFLGGVWLRWKWLTTRQQKRVSQGQPNQAALELYKSLLSLHDAAGKSLPQWQGEPSSQLKELALKARFSQHGLTLEELLAFQTEWKQTVVQLKKELPLFKKLWIRYGLGLF